MFVTQTTSYAPKKWPADRFAAVADHVAVRYNVQVAFLGTTKGAPAIDAIRRAMRRDSVSLAGATEIPTLCAVLCRADAAVTLDTGTMHLARAVGLPMVVVAPPWSSPYEWLPLRVPACIILRRDDIPCRVCGSPSCDTHDRMDEIGTAAVIEAVGTLLAEHPPAPDRRRRRVERCLARGRMAEPRLRSTPQPVRQ